jgi:hypothetical protein
MLDLAALPLTGMESKADSLRLWGNRNTPHLASSDHGYYY